MRILTVFPLLTVVGCGFLGDSLKAGEAIADGIQDGMEDGQVVQVTVSIDSASLKVGDEVSIAAEAEYSDGGTADYTDLVQWSVNKEQVAEVDGGMLIALAEGSAKLSASWGDLESDAVKFTVAAGGGGGNNSKADLLVSNVEAVTFAGGLSYHVTVENGGDAASGANTVDVYLDQAISPTVGEYGQYYVDVPSLQPGEDAVVVLDGSVSAYVYCLGGCTSWVQVDAEGLQKESDEGNNVMGPVSVDTEDAAPPPTSGKAELELVSMKAMESPAGWNYEVVVKNSGTAEAGTFSVDLYPDQPTAPAVGSLGQVYNVVYSLGAGAQTTVTLDSTLDCSTTCTWWVQLDSELQVDEDDEYNNISGPNYATASPVTPTGKANLVITDVWESGGSSPIFTVFVENTGTVDAPSVDVDVFMNQSTAPALGVDGDFYGSSLPVAAGTSTAVIIPSVVACASDCDAWFSVDVDDDVDEEDENDNGYGPIIVNP
jgi:hypothetical protein